MKPEILVPKSEKNHKISEIISQKSEKTTRFPGLFLAKNGGFIGIFSHFCY